MVQCHFCKLSRHQPPKAKTCQNQRFQAPLHYSLGQTLVKPSPHVQAVLALMLEMSVTLCKITSKAFFGWSEWALQQDKQCLEGAQFCIFHFRRTATEKSLERLGAG
jgi:hypothetical protein